MLQPLQKKASKKFEDGILHRKDGSAVLYNMVRNAVYHLLPSIMVARAPLPARKQESTYTCTDCDSCSDTDGAWVRLLAQ